MAEQTIGQEFAIRWLVKNYDNYRHTGIPENLFQQIAEAVDTYVAKKQTEFEKELRRVALVTAEGETGQGGIEVDSNQILEHYSLVAVAKRWPRQSLSPIYRFPV